MIIADVLAKAQKQNLRTEMEVFLAHLLDMSRLDLIAHSDEEIPVDKLGLLQIGWTRILNDEPVAYLTNKKEFYGMNFYVDKRVLVPRGETERLVDFVLEKAEEDAGVKRVVEVGTGSGAVAIAIKKHNPKLDVLAIDVDLDAILVANKNVVQHEVAVELIQSDLLENLPVVNFDILVANLPYIAESEEIADGVRKHEPHKALFAGEDGLDLYKRLFEQIRDQNRKFKWIMGEIGFLQREGVNALVAEILPGYSCEVLKDHQDLDRYFVLGCQ